MARAIRFHLDEVCDPRIAAGLRRRGVDVTTAADAGLLGAPDTAHMAFAWRQARVIVTHDADFLRLHAGGAEHAALCIAPFMAGRLGISSGYLL